MKRIYPSFIVLTMLYSCSIKEITETPNKGIDVKVKADVEELVDKTYLGESSGVSNTVLWGPDEQMFLSIWDESDNQIGFAWSDKTSDFNGKARAVFDFNLEVGKASSYLYSGIYPASAVNDDNNAISDFKVTLPQEQNATATSYDPSAYIMVAKPEAFSSVQTSWTASFRRAVALNKFTLTGLPAGVRNVTVSLEGQHLSGVRSIDVKTGKSKANDGKETAVSVDYSTGLAEGPIDVWFTSWGALLDEGKTITIVAKTIQKKYTKTFSAKSKGFSLIEGCLNTVSFNMQGAKSEDTGADFIKVKAGNIKPGIKNAVVVEGIFDPLNDKLKLTCNGAAKEDVHPTYYKVEEDKITIYNHINRIDQSLQFFLVRGGKDYELSEILRVVKPSGSDGYVPDAQFRNVIVKERGLGSDGRGLGAPSDIFDFCGMIDLDKAAKLTCTDDIQISGWGFKSIEGIEAFTNLGKEGWDKPLVRMWGNGELLEADLAEYKGFSTFNFSSCPKLTKVVAGPNMGGFEDLANCPLLTTIDISRGKYITNLQFLKGVPALRLMDLRYQPGGHEMSSAGYIDFRGLSSISDTDIKNLLIKINTDYLVHHNDSRGWKEGVYAAWKRGAKIDVYEYGDNTKFVGTVPSYESSPSALSPENGLYKDGKWLSSNVWPADSDYSKALEAYWQNSFKGRYGFHKAINTSDGNRPLITLAGLPIYVSGINCYDLFLLSVNSSMSTKQMEEVVDILAAEKVPVVRFSCSVYSATEMNYYTNRKAEFLNNLDKLATLCDKAHILLVPSFFWNASSLPDYFSEQISAWGNTTSKTYKFMQSYTTELVNVLKSHKCIAAWECGNEFNLKADIGIWGHPQVSAAQIATALSGFGNQVLAADDAGRLIFTGNSVMRNPQWHLFKKNTSQNDSYSQYVEITGIMTPDPIDGMSEHIYCAETRVFSDLGTLNTHEQIKKSLECARSLGKVFYLGEFDGPRSAGASSQIIDSFYDSFYNLKVQLSMVWNYSHNNNVEKSFPYDSDDARYIFRKIREANISYARAGW